MLTVAAPGVWHVLWHARRSGWCCRFRLPERRSDSHFVPVRVGQPCLAHPPRAILGDRPSRDDAVDVIDVEVHMGARAAVGAVLGQMQLRRATPQPHIQRPVRREGVLRFDFEPELCIPVDACSRIGYMQDRGHTLHRFPLPDQPLGPVDRHPLTAHLPGPRRGRSPTTATG
jgi:hypothetical protein